MKTMILSIFLLSFFDVCFGQIKVNETNKQKAEKADIMHFFACMTSNNHLEKIAKENYYIFDTINGELYYGKVNSGFFKEKITEVFKIDTDTLCKQLPNVGYELGALANVSDILTGFKPQKVDLVTEHSDATGHSAIVEEGSNAGGNDGIISVGPDWKNASENSTWHWTKGTNAWKSYSDGTKAHPIWRQTLNVNKGTINKYGQWLNKLENAGKLVYSVELSSCVTHTSVALNLSGVFNIGIHPYLLNAQMYLWSNGINHHASTSFGDHINQ
jgi:hypothetical protein